MAELGEIVTTPKLPDIRVATFDDIFSALQSGITDFRLATRFGIAIGGFYTLGGLLVLLVANYLGFAFLAFPIIAGFALIGPFAAIALYEISRLIERNEVVTWAAIAAGLTPNVRRECAYLGTLMIFLMAIWLKSGAVVYAMFFGMRALSLPVLIDALFTTSAGWGFLIVGHAIGAFFATLVFSLSVVAFPLMVDRGTDFITALITSIRTVASNPTIFMPWGAMIGIALVAAFLPFFLGLLIVLPVLGHTSWHLYRRVVA